LEFLPYIDPAALVGWLVIGAAAGWLVSRLVRDGLGPIGHMVIGIIGACIGGYVLPDYGYLPAELPGDLIGGAIGAAVVLGVNTLISTLLSSS
jgi:uncharacterized membrane protein YeaQ/YmgE (transglycosylase-associated protein family)